MSNSNRKVFIVNRSPHDFSSAKSFGELVFLSEGVLGRYEVNNMARQFKEVMKESCSSDLILPCGLSNMNAIACSIFAAKHKRLNLLLFKSGVYIERNLLLNEEER